MDPNLPRLLFPKEVEFEAIDDFSLATPLTCLESSLITKAVPKRVADFRAGRHCARIALSRLGQTRFDLLCGEYREPLWPIGIVGSISHCSNMAAAVVARDEDYISIGIDIETAEPLPSSLVKRIALPEEIGMITDWDKNIPWSKLLFSVKEAFYKAWFPITKHRLEFHDVIVRILPFDNSSSGEFSVLLPSECTKKDLSALGRFVLHGGYWWTGYSILQISRDA
ncbi:MAG: 4'-phosphopantetheinyl transferase superfamily protein [Planctomycetes bacterium]|nr:4'-phosphopantetheinyl transferase superfamily protein [Planctomycetota bacterium]